VKGARLVPTATNYIRLRVADLSRSVQFYQWLFGIEISSSDPSFSRTFRNGDSLLELTPMRAGSTSLTPGIDLMGVMFSDFSPPSALEILRERGIDARVSGSARLVASDPDGIQIMLSGTE
jgi:hypothetical protein